MKENNEGVDDKLDQEEVQEIVEQMIETHNVSPEFRKMVSESAPWLHNRLKMVRAYRLLVIIIPLLILSVFLILFAKGIWFSFGIGGIIASVVHFLHMVRLGVQKNKLINK